MLSVVYLNDFNGELSAKGCAKCELLKITGKSESPDAKRDEVWTVPLRTGVKSESGISDVSRPLTPE